MTTARYKKIVDIVGVTIAAIGVPLFFVGQFQEVQRERVNRTLNYVEEYNRGDIFEVRKEILEAWSTLPISVGQLSDLEANPVIWDKLVDDLAVTNPEFRSAVIELVSYFDTVGFCVSVHECDADTARQLIASPATAFCNLYGSLVDDIRSEASLSTFGGGLVELVALNERDVDCDV